MSRPREKSFVLLRKNSADTSWVPAGFLLNSRWLPSKLPKDSFMILKIFCRIPVSPIFFVGNVKQLLWLQYLMCSEDVQHAGMFLLCGEHGSGGFLVFIHILFRDYLHFASFLLNCTFSWAAKENMTCGSSHIFIFCLLFPSLPSSFLWPTNWCQCTILKGVSILQMHLEERGGFTRETMSEAAQLYLLRNILGPDTKLDYANHCERGFCNCSCVFRTCKNDVSFSQMLVASTPLSSGLFFASSERNQGGTYWEMRKKGRADPPLWTNTQRSLLELTHVHLFIKRNLNRQLNRHNGVASCWVFTSKNNTRKQEEVETTGHERSKHFCDESEGETARGIRREKALVCWEVKHWFFFSLLQLAVVN